MRVTLNTIFYQVTQAINKNMEDLSTENIRLGTGKKIQAPSDDVGGSLRALAYRVDLSGNDQYQQNITNATTGLNILSTTLSSLSTTIANAKHLIPMASAGTMDVQTAGGLSNEAAQLRDQMLSLGNTTSMGQYVFAGFQTKTQPYSTTPSAIPTVVNSSAGATIAATVTNEAALTLHSYTITFDAANNYYVNDMITGAPVTTGTYNPAGITTIALPPSPPALQSGMDVTIDGTITPVSATDSFSVLQPAARTYDYQGDNGKINALTSQNGTMQTNVTGTDAFSYTLGAPGTTYTKQIDNGLNVHYTQGPGTTINVEIRQPDNVSRATDDTFSFSNVIQMTNLLSAAINNNDRSRMQALADPLDAMATKVNAVQTDIGARLGRLGDQKNWLASSSANLTNTIGDIENADMADTGVQLQKINTVLQALYASSSKLLSQSLFDFLK